MATHKLLLLPGDGIGPEVMAEVKKLIAWMNGRGMGTFETEEGLVGGSCYDAHKVSITDATMEKAHAADAVLFVSPEYNRTMPGALKNAIDVGSRPYGASAWSGKPAAVMTLSPGGIGGFGANHDIRQALVFLDMPVLQQPEAYVGGAYDIFDEAGEFKTERTRDFFANFITAFADWVARTAPVRNDERAAA